MLESEVWNLRTGAGKRSLEFRAGMTGCRKSRLGVWRKGTGNRDLESGGRVPEGFGRTRMPESETGVWRKTRGPPNQTWSPDSTGKPGLEFGSLIVPESETQVSEDRCRNARRGRRLGV